VLGREKQKEVLEMGRKSDQRRERKSKHRGRKRKKNRKRKKDETDITVY
jgi:hypothetical protein